MDFEAKHLPFFAYGTLRPGFGNYQAILGDTPHVLVDGTVDGADMYARMNAFPYVVSGTGTIVGTLVDVSEDDFLYTLVRMDTLEGYSGPTDPDNHYDRTIVQVQTDEGMVPAYMYVASDYYAAHARTTLPKVESGDWKEWSANYITSGARRV